MVIYEISGGWFFLVFFAALSILGVGMLLPGASALKLDEEGFEATKYFRSHRARWRDVKNFRTVVLTPPTIALVPGSTELVVYDDIKSTDGIMATVNRAFSGHNAYLPDTYGIPGEELARLMGWWRERAASQQ